MVLENRRPACYPLSSNWTQWKYSTFDEAHAYAIAWLGAYGYHVKLELNVLYKYNGYDRIEIVKKGGPIEEPF